MQLRIRPEIQEMLRPLKPENEWFSIKPFVEPPEQRGLDPVDPVQNVDGVTIIGLDTLEPQSERNIAEHDRRRDVPDIGCMIEGVGRETAVVVLCQAIIHRLIP